MRRSSTASAVVLGWLLATATAAAQDFDVAGEHEMLARINAMRAAQNLAPLVRHDALDAVARAHSRDMAQANALSHVSDTTGTPADRVRRAGVSATTIAENVALHRTTAEAHEALIASEAHRANMLSPDVTHVGLGALRTERGVYVTQVFAAIAPAAPEVAQAPEPAPEPEPAAPEPEPAAPAIAAPFEERAEAPSAPSGQDCFSPLPGVRICGRLPAPSLERVQPSPPVASAPAPAAPAPATPAPQSVVPLGRRFTVPAGTNGTVVHQHGPDGRVEAYWVYGSGRWWYYPLPPDARPGQQLQPDLRVTGPPPGFPEHPGQAPVPLRPQAWRIAPAPPPPPAGAIILEPRGPQIGVAPGTAFYAVPPPPMMGRPDRAWRRAHAQWRRAYRRWLREQARLHRHAL